MDYNKTAGDLYNLIISYSDYLDFGYSQAHDQYEFNIPVKDNENKVKEQSVKSEAGDENLVKQKKRDIISLAETIIKCGKCILGKSSGRIPGQGNVNAKLFIAALPVTEDEESAGRPLTGAEGEYLKKWLASIDIKPDEVFISNIVKCNAKQNQITRDVIEICREHLDRQIDIVKPKIILGLGQLVLSSLKRSSFDITKYHGELFYYKNIKTIATFNPAEVLKDQSLKKFVWADLKKISFYLKEKTDNE